MDGKDDTGKLRWSLLMWDALEECVKVLEDGALVHGSGSWESVPNGRVRYADALQRHMVAHWKGELIDPVHGHPHMAHIAVNALFLLALQMRSIEK